MLRGYTHLRRRIMLFTVVVVLFLVGGNQFMTIRKLKRNLDQIGEDNYKYHVRDIVKQNLKLKITRNDQTYGNSSLFNPFKCFSTKDVFQPAEPREFPSSNNPFPRIPHRIHQICDNELILDVYAAPMQSFIVNNPSWEYWFWTYESGRNLLKDEYPFLLNTFDRFKSVKKADLLRYAIIHKFGGVYADLDVRNIRALDKATTKFSCIVPTEPFEHSAFLYRKSFILNQAVLLCRSRHPFFTHLLLNLQLVPEHLDPVEATGPMYITRMFMLYNNLTTSLVDQEKIDDDTNSPFFYKGTRHFEDEDAVYIPNSQYFMDTVDPRLVVNETLQSCGSVQIDGIVQNHPREYRACNEFECRKGVRQLKEFAFMVHHWHHLWLMSDKEKKALKKLHVNEILKNYKMYNKKT